MNVRTRRATDADVAVLADFNLRLAWETERRRLDPATVQRGVQGLIASPAYGFYLVAETADQAVGCLLITFEWSDWRDGIFWWIQSVYVRDDHRRQGVFTALFEAVRRQARAEPRCCGLRLYVEKDNDRAQKTYAKLGMTPTHYLIEEIDFATAGGPRLAAVGLTGCGVCSSRRR